LYSSIAATIFLECHYAHSGVQGFFNGVLPNSPPSQLALQSRFVD